MATDIRLQISFLQHPKTVKLRKRLGDGAVLSMISLWFFAAQNRPDGFLLGMDDEDIEIASNWNGDNGLFVKTLVNLRWLERKDGVCQIHDWQENNPYVAETGQRSEYARKAANTRWEREKQRKESMQEQCESNADAMRTHEKSMQEQCNGNAPDPIPIPLPIPIIKPPPLPPVVKIAQDPLHDQKTEGDKIIRMAMSEIRNLHVKYLGTIPHNQPIASTLLNLCQNYPRDRLIIAFQAVASAKKPNLNWIRSYLDNHDNWNSEANRGKKETAEEIMTANREAIYDACRQMGVDV